VSKGVFVIGERHKLPGRQAGQILEREREREREREKERERLGHRLLLAT
jgi:hypothetical protein